MLMLVTLDEMKNYLNIPLATTTFDVFLNREIVTISAAIHGYCGRIFNLQNYTEKFYADDFDETLDTLGLYMFHFPITTIDTVELIETDENGNDTPFAITTLRTKKDSGRIFRTRTSGGKQKWFESLHSNQRLEFIYNAGFAVIPEPIQSVVLSIVAERYNKDQLGVPLDFGSDVQRISIPGVMGIDFDYTLTANGRETAFGMIIGNYINILDYYRSERPITGEIRIVYIEVN